MREDINFSVEIGSWICYFIETWIFTLNQNRFNIENGKERQ